MSVNNDICRLFQVYLRDPDEFESGWKGICLELHTIAYKNPGVFTKDAQSGFSYLVQVITNTVCTECEDEKAFTWLKLFATAWLLDQELPKFPSSCWFNESDDDIPVLKLYSAAGKN